MRSKELEQFWLKIIEQKNISDEELMKRLLGLSKFLQL